MAIPKPFEDLECWQEARQLAKVIFLSCELGRLAKDHATANQLKKAAVSLITCIGNCVQKDPRYGVRDIDAAQDSLIEIKNISYILDDLEYIPIRYIEAIQLKTDKVKISLRDYRRRIENRDKLTGETKNEVL